MIRASEKTEHVRDCLVHSFHFTDGKNRNLEKEDDLPLSLDYLVGKPELNPSTLDT